MDRKIVPAWTSKMTLMDVVIIHAYVSPFFPSVTVCNEVGLLLLCYKRVVKQFSFYAFSYTAFSTRWIPLNI